MAFYTYILSCKSRTAIYIGATGDLLKRVSQHKLKTGSLHTTKYNIDRLVWFERHDSLAEALHRERQIKRWRRVWKEDLIAKSNPEWRDLTMELSFA